MIHLHILESFVIAYKLIILKNVFLSINKQRKVISLQILNPKTDLRPSDPLPRKRDLHYPRKGHTHTQKHKPQITLWLTRNGIISVHQSLRSAASPKTPPAPPTRPGWGAPIDKARRRPPGLRPRPFRRPQARKGTSGANVTAFYDTNIY